MEDIAHMLNTLPDDAAGVRNYAMITLLMATGIRVSELVNLKTNDVNLRAKMLHVIGKGNKERLVPIDEATCDILKGYLYNERKELNVLSSDLLFVTEASRSRGKTSTIRFERSADRQVSEKSHRICCVIHLPQPC